MLDYLVCQPDQIQNPLLIQQQQQINVERAVVLRESSVAPGFFNNASFSIHHFNFNKILVTFYISVSYCICFQRSLCIDLNSKGHLLCDFDNRQSFSLLKKSEGKSKNVKKHQSCLRVGLSKILRKDATNIGYQHLTLHSRHL